MKDVAIGRHPTGTIETPMRQAQLSSMKIPAHRLKPLAYAGGGALVVAVCLSLSSFWHLANAEERFYQRMAEWHARASLMVEQHDAHLVALAAVLQAGDVAVFDKTASAILAAYPQIDSINLEAPKTPAPGRYPVERVVGQNTIGMAQPDRTIHLLWLVRRNPDAIYREEVERLMRLMPSASFTVHDSTSQGHFDFERLDASKPKSVFICGPDHMMDQSEQWLLRKGMRANQIISERFKHR